MLGTKYVVREDDTLWDLSNKFLGDPTKWPLIYKHNNTSSVVKLTGSSIPEQDIIHVGQVLYIPGKDSKPTTIPGKPVHYIHFKSKARQYEKYKNSVFLQGVAAPVSKVKLDQISSIKVDSKKEKEYALRLMLARRISNESIQKFFTKIDSIPELVGAGVLYMDKEFTLVKIRLSKRKDRLMVLMREVNKYDQLNAIASYSANQRVIKELLYMGLSCTGAALGYVALTAEGLAVPVSVGSSSLLIPVTTVGTLASSASCGVYAGRVINESVGHAEYNEYLNESIVFGHVMTALDIASLASVAATYKSGATLIKQLASKKMSKQTLFQRWKAMPRADRKKLLKDIIKADNPRINNKQLKGILRSMDAPKVFSQAQVRKAMVGELIGAISAVFSTSSSIADGSLNKLAIAFIADEQKD